MKRIYKFSEINSSFKLQSYDDIYISEYCSKKDIINLFVEFFCLGFSNVFPLLFLIICKEG